MELQRVIQYRDLFPEEGNNLPDVQSFIRGLRREDLCTITANMMARIAGKPFFDVALDPRRGSLICYDSFFHTRIQISHRI